MAMIKEDGLEPMSGTSVEITRRREVMETSVKEDEFIEVFEAVKGVLEE
jgi:hypothetical protein